MPKAQYSLKKGLSRRQKRMLTGYMFISPFLIGFLCFILGPMITTARMSFSSVSIDAANSRFVLEPVETANYLRALTVDANFNRLLTESLEGMALQVPLVTIVSLFLAVMLNRVFPGRGAVRAIFFLPVILTSGIILKMETGNAMLASMEDVQNAAVSSTSITGYLETLLTGAFGEVPLVQTILSMVNKLYDIVIASSIQTVIFLSGLQAIPGSLYESAKIEGCTSWETFWKITFPMVSPLILVNWIYGIVDYAMRSDNKLITYIETFRQALDYGFASAMSLIYSLSVVLIVGISYLIISRMVYYYD
ncbi:MAG: sugar ABC transporter permease [Lachnospiraceae bacterium]|nr:sugar ABC transporter permease [Lachnospiraceae bacterium]